jgi:murein DD-endopeptidase MepM/ murein hydrolase activator NlpD/SH3-like domain-containing protein
MLLFPFRRSLYGCLLFGLLCFCTGIPAFSASNGEEPPYERYKQQLHEEGLDETLTGRQWLQAGEDALLDSVMVKVPFRETGYYAYKQPAALSYRFRLPADGRVMITVRTKTKGGSPLFADVFALEDAPREAPEPVAYLEPGRSQLRLNVESGKTYLLRLQPTLAYAGNYTVSITTIPTFTFPVKGKDARAIGSFWGASREGGKRRHEGIDIFARKGTPVVAATDGVVSNVGTTRLGGKVVWVINKNLQAVYYAHLDKQLVKVGQVVKEGDVLGTVGNTGNARYTPAHLHFGVYRGWGGATNPLPYVKHITTPPPAITAALERLRTRVSPSAKSPALREIPKATVLTLTAAAGQWFRAELPDGVVGYVHAPQVEGLTRSLHSTIVKKSQALLAEPLPEATPVARLKAGSTIKVLGRFDAFLLVQNGAGQKGWIEQAPARTASQYLSRVE